MSYITESHPGTDVVLQNMDSQFQLTEVIKANQKVHTRFADIYDSTEPHFRPENRAKVRSRILLAIESLSYKHHMLDVGCGTGFLIELAHDLFVNVSGVDVTQAMLNKIDLSPGNINLFNAPAENIPLESGCVDFAASYSFLDHVADIEVVFREVHRLLRVGGIFYSDLIPNRSFWTALSQINRPEVESPLVLREYREVVEHDKKMEEEWNVNPTDWRLTEPGKANFGGFDAAEIKALLEAAGFHNVKVEVDWFLGEASVIHGKSPEVAGELANHLRAIRPLTDGLFKYLYFVAQK